MSIRIILVDDHRIVREGVSSILRACPEFDVIAEAGDGITAIKLTMELLPDIVIMDISLPDMNGIEAVREILSANPKIKILALSMHADTSFARDMLDSGASGYLLKDCASDELVHAVRMVNKDQVYVSPQIANTLIKDYRDRNGHNPTQQEKLSARELTVLRFLSEGKSIKETASLMNISPKTVETMRFRIIRKTGVQSNADLIKYAIRIGLTTLDK
jgi:DNA-binding NarL/FixJ family response regulator